jgi:hypothetical protein
MVSVVWVLQSTLISEITSSREEKVSPTGRKVKG